jgi:DNA primase
MFSPIEEIKNRLDIVEVIGNYIRLQKTGANFRALCPFHSEKKPSFFVSPTRQIWHCFGCSKGGDVFGFVKEIEGVEFGDALRMLAQKAGVELKPIRPELKTERSRLYEICELATRFFEKQLEDSKTGKEVKKYLLGRGISEDSIKNWRIGYAPDVWQGLSDFLTSRDYKKEEVEKAGLGLTSEKGSFYDRFRGRIIFPIFDLNSQVVGFGGRVFGPREKEEIAKYINTPNTLIYDKSRILYGLDRAKVEIRKKNECVLVEGYTDVILVSQAGFGNVAATSGTALTPYQLKILKRYSENLLTAFDMDIAGDSATKRGIDLAQSSGFNVKILMLPEDSDPADVVSRNPEDWEKLLQESKSILDFYFSTTFSRLDSKTPEGKKEISKILLPPIKRIPNNIERSFWIQELAKRLEVKEEDVAEELKKVKLTEEIYGLEPEEIVNLPPKSRKELLEERILVLLLVLKSPEVLKFIKEEEITFFKPEIQEILRKIKTNIIEGSKFETMGFSSQSADLFNVLFLQAEIEEIADEDKIPEIKNCLKELRHLEIKNKLDEISKEIKKAEEEKDSKKIENLIKEFNLCSKSLLDLEQI